MTLRYPIACVSGLTRSKRLSACSVTAIFSPVRSDGISMSDHVVHSVMLFIRLTGRLTVQLHEMELSVGDVLQVGEHTVTVLDIENGEVTFRVEESDSGTDGNDGASSPRPR